MSLELREPPTLSDRILAAELAIVGTVAALVRVEPVQGFETPRLAGFFEVQVERTLFGDPPSERVLVRVLGDGPEDDPTWTTELRSDVRLLLLLSRDVAPELPDDLFTPYFDSAFEIDDDLVAFPADVLDDLSRRAMRPERGRVTLDRMQKLFDTLRRERAERERELEALIPQKRLGRYPEVLEAPTAAVPTEAPLGPPGPLPQPDVLAGREAKLETAPKPEPAGRRAPRRQRPRRSS